MSARSAPGAAPAPELIAYSADVFDQTSLPPATPVLDPVLTRTHATLIAGQGGVGKSWLALALAHAAASGTAALGWPAASPARVVYVDAAMSQTVLQARLRALAGGATVPRTLTLVSGDAQVRGFPDLATASGLEALDRLVAGADLVVLDGLSRLIHPGRGAGARWSALADWIRALRRQGRAVLLVDAQEPPALAGLAETALWLRLPMDYYPDEGCRFSLTVSRARAFTGLARRRFEARLAVASGRAEWTKIDGHDEEAIRAWRLHRCGFTMVQIGAQMNVSAATACRLVKSGGALPEALRESALNHIAPAPSRKVPARPAAPDAPPHPPETVKQPPAEPAPALLTHPPETVKCVDPPAQIPPPADPKPGSPLEAWPIDRLIQLFLARRRYWLKGLKAPDDALGLLPYEHLRSFLTGQISNRILNQHIRADDAAWR